MNETEGVKQVKLSLALFAQDYNVAENGRYIPYLHFMGIVIFQIWLFYFTLLLASENCWLLEVCSCLSYFLALIFHFPQKSDVRNVLVFYSYVKQVLPMQLG